MWKRTMKELLGASEKDIARPLLQDKLLPAGDDHVCAAARVRCPNFSLAKVMACPSTDAGPKRAIST